MPLPSVSPGWKRFLRQQQLYIAIAVAIYAMNGPPEGGAAATGFGSAALVDAGAGTVAVLAVGFELAPPVPALNDFTKLTICQRCVSGRLAHAGIPFSMLPCVMNQKTSPADADFVGSASSSGMLPVPLPVLPWQLAHFCSYSVFPACTALACPASGFFICFAVFGAP